MKWSTSCSSLPVLLLHVALLLHSAISQNAVTDGVCGESKGCFGIPENCDPAATGDNGCTASSTWRYMATNETVSIQLRASTTTYIAIGFSKSGGMEDSDVYACTSDGAVVRSRNEQGSRSNTPAAMFGVSEEDVVVADGVISCSFLRKISLPEGQDDSGNFFDLSAQEYTALLAWSGSLDQEGNIQQHQEKQQSASPINFLEFSVVEAGSTGALAKLHGCLMLLAWIGFASIGITTARFFKKALPGEICGKQSWFSVHRSCMVMAFVLTIIAFIVIIIHVGGYLQPAGGRIRFTHAIIGTIVVALACLNVLMALVRPHPGMPRRNLFNWAHWGVGVTAHLLAGITVMLGTSNRPSQAPDVLLQSIPGFVFWLVIALTFFHLFSWLALTLIDIFKKTDSSNVTVHHHAGTDKTHTSTNNLTSDEDTQKEPVVKLVIYGVYVAVVVGVVIAMVISVGIGSNE